MSTCHNNPEKLSTAKINEDTSSGYSFLRQCWFDATKNKLDCYKGKNCRKMFCKDSKKYTTNIINYEKRKMIPLTYEENKSYKKQNVCYIWKKKKIVLMMKIKSIKKSEIIVIMLGNIENIAAHNICNLRYKIPTEIPVVFHNGTTYNHKFIINDLTKEVEGWFECLGENTDRYITFSAPIKKELNNGKTITYKLKFIDSFRFMSSSLSSLVNNLSEI